MKTEKIYSIDLETKRLFALKGLKDVGANRMINNINGVKVRRVMQIISDFSTVPFDQLHILDLACGEGVYSIEAALRGAQVFALDARTERMDEGAKAANRLGLTNICFDQADIRSLDITLYGRIDVVLLLGILYHLDGKDILPVLENAFEICRQFVIIDTHIATHNMNELKFLCGIYEGKQFREHGDNDPKELRRSRLLASIDNPLSFRFTKESLFRALHDVGFSSVYECNVPMEPLKPADRITVIAMKGEPVLISTYPWVNGRSEDEIKRIINK